MKLCVMFRDLQKDALIPLPALLIKIIELRLAPFIDCMGLSKLLLVNLLRDLNQIKMQLHYQVCRYVHMNNTLHIRRNFYKCSQPGQLSASYSLLQYLQLLAANLCLLSMRRAVWLPSIQCRGFSLARESISSHLSVASQLVYVSTSTLSSFFSSRIQHTLLFEGLLIALVCHVLHCTNFGLSIMYYA